MPITTLNKVIAIFLTGGLALSALLILWWPEIFNWLGGQPDEGHERVFGIASLVAIIIASVLGMAIDGASELLIRRHLRSATRTVPTHWLFRVLRKNALLELLWMTRSWSVQAAQGHWIAKHITPDPQGKGREEFQLAAEIFHKNSSAHEYDMTISHYGTFYLASNYALVLILALPLPLYLYGQARLGTEWLAWTMLLAVLAYCSMAVAADRYVYTYLSAFRFSTLWLTENAR